MFTYYTRGIGTAYPYKAITQNYYENQGGVMITYLMPIIKKENIREHVLYMIALNHSVLVVRRGGENKKPKQTKVRK